MDYKEKLRAFNSTEKSRETNVLNSLLSEYRSLVLDYDLGLGRAIAYIIGANGYDVNDYNECLSKLEYFNILPKKTIQIYFFTFVCAFRKSLQEMY